MRRAKHSRGKFSPGVAWPLGALVLGIVCVCWALINIRAQPVSLPDTYRSVASSPTASVEQEGRLAGNVVALKQPARLSGGAPSPKTVVYAKNPSDGDVLGSLSIPVLGTTLPVIEGTSANDLKKGVGHFAQSVMPGADDNCVLSGHRDTVLVGLGKLKIGDRLIVQTATGTYTYQIKRIRIVQADDRTVIVPTGHAVLTLTTCYPFYFIGSAPDRYVLRADLVTRS
jgi:sortase A